MCQIAILNFVTLCWKLQDSDLAHFEETCILVEVCIRSIGKFRNNTYVVCIVTKVLRAVLPGVRNGNKSPNQETGFGNRGHLKVLKLNWSLMIKGGHSYSFRTNLVSFRTFRYPLFPKTVSWLGLFCCFLQQDGSSFNWCQYNLLTFG